MSKYIIGIDGGGTSTDGALFDMDGTIVKTYQSGFANFRVKQDVAKDNLITTITQLMDGIEPSEVEFIQIGIAGIPDDDMVTTLEREFSERFSTTVSIVTDALIALYSIKKDQDQCVVMVLGGTGSAVMIGADQTVERIGGYGHLLGDEGSAYHLSISALRQIIYQYENNLSLSPLSKHLLTEIHASSHLQIKDFVYNNTKQDIARLSKVIGELAEQGNKEAIALFQQEGQHLAEQTLRALNKLPHCEHVVIGLRGNFVLQAPYVKDALFDILSQKHISYSVDKHPVDPVVGAFYLGLEQLTKR